jgi:hypothetical protein
MSRSFPKTESALFLVDQTSHADVSRIRALSYHITSRTDALSAWAQTIDTRINDGREFSFLTHSVLRRVAASMVDEAHELVATAARLKEILDDA